MQKIDKIHIQTINHDKTVGNSRLELKLTSKSIDYVVINTLRRTVLTDIPIYAFTNFKFEKNTTVFNNNYIKLRLNNIPVWFIENKITFFNKENNIEKIVEVDEDEDDDEYQEPVKPIDTNILNQLTMYINYKNTTNDIVSVTTDDAKFYYEEKLIKSPYNSPVQLIKLQPGQEIAFSAITNLGTEEQNAIFSPVSVCYYNQLTDNEFLFILESRGQLVEQRILHVAIDNIIKRMNNFLKLLENNTDNLIEGVININNEDHTLGNIISRGMQQHENISFAGYNILHPLAKKVELHYKLKKLDNINNVIKDVVNYYSNIYTTIKSMILFTPS